MWKYTFFLWGHWPTLISSLWQIYEAKNLGSGAKVVWDWGFIGFGPVHVCLTLICLGCGEWQGEKEMGSVGRREKNSYSFFPWPTSGVPVATENRFWNLVLGGHLIFKPWQLLFYSFHRLVLSGQWSTRKTWQGSYRIQIKFPIPPGTESQELGKYLHPPFIMEV